MSEVAKSHCLITGASSGIGLAAVERLLEQPPEQLGNIVIHAVSRHPDQCAALQALQSSHPQRLLLHPVDLCSDHDLTKLQCAVQDHCSQLRLVFHAAGVLHEGPLQPEKSITQISRANLARVFDLNACAPILLAQALLPLLRGRHQSTFASLSARVGSIGDNRLGGWYAYRASKAAQNQLLRTFAIELQRLNPRACCLLLHPGTVDTPLSRPFQRNVPADKLFDPQRAAKQLLDLSIQATASDSGRFLAWDGSEVPW